MAKSDLLNARTISYLELIGNGKTYRVPAYQRDYSWSEEQWEDLWNDIDALQKDPEAYHYMGALMVERTGDRDVLVLDGQQRLATLSLLVLAIIAKLETRAREGIDPEDNLERSRKLRYQFVGRKDPASITENSYLLLKDTDDALYRDYLIQIKEPSNPHKFRKSNRLLIECFRYFGERIQGLEVSQNDGDAVATLLSETVARQILFTLISVGDKLDAYPIFEAFNARGVELTATDLLKNYLFSLVRVPADLEALQRRWESLVETAGQAQFPTFLRYHLLCRQSKIRSQELFKLVRNQTRTAQEVFQLLDELESRCELFAAILDPTHGYWLDSPGAKKHVGELGLFRTHQPMPLLFAAWERFSKDDFIRVLKLVSVISFRYTIVSGLNTNDLEPVYHRAAKAVADGEATTPADIFRRLSPIYVSDEKMQQDFSQLEINTKGHKKLAKYILAGLEQQMSSRACDPNTDPGTVEHILPENPEEGWEETYPSDKWDNDVYRLGNLTLLEASANREIGNKPYAKKRPAYEQSSYDIAREISKMAPEQWTPDLVNERQTRLAKVAAQVWKSDFR